METTTTYFPTLQAVQEAAQKLKSVVNHTPLTSNIHYSRKFDGHILFKREDLQLVRSYKIRGAYNKMSSLTPEEISNGVVCASAGNHAQGVALSCRLLKIPGTIFMPTPTPMQKIEQVKMFGEEFIEVVLEGDTFDDSYHAAMKEQKQSNKTFIHPFNDEKVIEGQATIALELLSQTETPIDYVFVPVGGGGLASGLSTIFKEMSPETKIIGVEPEGAPSMLTSLKNNQVTELDDIENFVDGAAVKRVGEKTFAICRQTLDDMIMVPEGKICQTILDLYNKEAIVVEPAGALSIAALDFYADKLKGKNVVCVVSGSNNDITRTAEIKERALLYSNLKHYFIVKFPQRAGALKEFVVEILGPNDDITHFEYTKKSNRDNGSAVVGIELKTPDDLQPLITKMKQHNFYGDYLNNKPDLFQFLV
ncbi:threonine ammonia-lyase IlvA [Mangrovimonas sp. AS39]|uniref:threonine ammonia-lyase IlvA n=1 Tax=Mangrovimonas futianensis TaxID=2895523 RepID=UPI001E4FFD9C|nr:threonine ammonia-lyase IlvA [Mangrovimonas futianensis]MCF1192386.1 threonine ammonia-lyase IlvA [Mangrovimonas futianensis]MCF1196284.1 threonine ammonia-lyase IlvA [Mangrovimonas futianensis]MCF1422645.1 threonine ammonia-lyase IlvA [Mangrovimonas futianensis]